MKSLRNSRVRRRDFIAFVGSASIASRLASSTAVAQRYPSRPITLVIPFPPGGGNDALGRMVADKMSKSIGQQIVVDNRGGAGGTIATRAVARSAPDGYTILLAYTGTLAINPSLYSNPGYDPRKDLAPIGLIARLPSVLVVHPSLPVRSVAELISFAKAQPGRIDYAFVPGTVGHITTELFADTAGIGFTRIPYKGNGPCHDRPHRRPCVDDVLVDLAGAGARARRRFERARSNEWYSVRPAPRSTDDCSVGHTWLRRHHSLWTAGTCWHPARHH
jgi:Tripartite tricarboxylate transporter family receptor